jgi:hypothetical protein
VIPAAELKRMRGCVGFDFPVEEMLRLFEHIWQREAELATAHRRIEHLTARMRYWRTQATGYPDSRQQREAKRKGA